MIGSKLSPFKMWCQKVLPLVYDESLSYYECLCKLTQYLNDVINQINIVTDNVETFEDEMYNSFNELKNYVDSYFDNLDVQNEINHKLDEMVLDGTMSNIIEPLLEEYEEELNTVVNEQNSRISVLEGRMDTFTHLPNGSTSGDAELADIRVGANGVTYSSAGNAVRGQYNELKNIINDEVNYPEYVTTAFNSLCSAGTGYFTPLTVEDNDTRLSNLCVDNGALVRTNVFQINVPTHFIIADGYSIAIARCTYQSSYDRYLLDSSLTWEYHTGDTLITPNDNYPDIVYMVKRNDNADISPSIINSILYIGTTNGLKEKISELENYTTPITFPFVLGNINCELYKNVDGYKEKLTLPRITKANGVTVFIDPDGEHNADGLTIKTPVKTIAEALNISNVQTILFLEGTYKVGVNYHEGEQINTSVNLVGIGEVIFDNDEGQNKTPIQIKTSCYIENIHFKYGASTVRCVLDADETVVFNKCIFSNSDDSLWSNGLSVEGGDSYVINCVAYNNSFDGFNYHENDTVINNAIEINCKSYNNGSALLSQSNGQSSNASTTHAGSKIVRPDSLTLQEKYVGE